MSESNINPQQMCKSEKKMRINRSQNPRQN